jgi:hypothetical protein
MIALHKPTALPDYLPLIDGVTTRHSLSPALLDPFDPEEVCHAVVSVSRASGFIIDTCVFLVVQPGDSYCKAAISEDTPCRESANDQVGQGVCETYRPRWAV